ncbi:MAG: thymidine phosphorylase [Hyphomicrobiaceae bacterium]
MSTSAISSTSPAPHRLRARRIGIDTQHEAVVFMHKECSVCRSEGFTAHTRILLRARDRHVIATLYQVASDLVARDEAALSESAWARLGLQDGEFIAISHPDPVESMSHVRSRIYGQELSEAALKSIIGDVVDGKYSDIHKSSFITACATRPLAGREVLALTRAMVDVARGYPGTLRSWWTSTRSVGCPVIAPLSSSSRSLPLLRNVAAAFGMQARVNMGDGRQPIGRGIGPALEARDILAVLQDARDAPQDLRARAIAVAGALIELAGAAEHGAGETLAAHALANGRAWSKFQRICEAQGGMRVPPRSRHRRPLLADRAGRIVDIDNRKLAKLAKLAGAPRAKAAGIELHVRLGSAVAAGEPMCTLHADAPGELAYALQYASANPAIIGIDEQ